MIKSMTGFGRAEVMEENRKFTVEIKSVNHRYFDVNIKMPKKLGFFESAIRNLLKEYMQRGKVDVFITYEDYNENNVALKYNEEIAREYLTHLNAMAEQFDLQNDITVGKLSKYPEVFTMEEQDVDEKELWSVLEKALRQACEQFIASREREGEQLYQDIKGKLAYLLTLVAQVEERSPQMLQEHRQKLLEKVQELLGDRKIDEGILATELIVYADKVCVDEETVRLRSHIDAMSETLDMQEAIGRKLDFIAQEMNREANTILSKANDKELSGIAINLKTEIEKIREQIQNIE